MQIIRYLAEGGAVHVGLLGDGGQVRRLGVSCVAELLRLSRSDLRALVESVDGPMESGEVRLLPPVDGRTEVWAAGVTYTRSREARREESTVADVYSLVYDADRPELFFKCAAWRVCGTGEPIGIRADSAVNVPEPELALVINRYGELIGLSVCDDVSSRSIEGENPLYLPQAKVYDGACALGPGIRPIWAVADPAALHIEVTVTRAGNPVWAASTSTSLLHRTFDDLTGYLRRAHQFPDGVVLSTGTGLVPELAFTLVPGDMVEIRIDEVGTLRNEVRTATDAAFTWLADGPTRAPA